MKNLQAIVFLTSRQSYLQKGCQWGKLRRQEESCWAWASRLIRWLRCLWRLGGSTRSHAIGDLCCKISSCGWLSITRYRCILCRGRTCEEELILASSVCNHFAQGWLLQHLYNARLSKAKNCIHDYWRCTHSYRCFISAGPGESQVLLQMFLLF